MSGLEATGFSGAVTIGLLLAPANPKNTALIATNATFISEIHASLGGSILAAPCSWRSARQESLVV